MTISTTTLKALRSQWKEHRYVCVGLDPAIELIPEHVRKQNVAATIIAFNQQIIESTFDLIAAYKPNIAFYEQHGRDGYDALKATILLIREISPNTPIILDAKRADIGNTNAGYAEAIFGDFGVDGTTLNPYFGFESLTPFAELADKLHFVLCRTSNPGAAEFQSLNVDGSPLYMRVAENVANSWNAMQNFGLVVGATNPLELAEIRRAVPQLPLLIPGVGAQGGEVEAVAESILAGGNTSVLVNSSRQILYASNGADFGDAARAATSQLAQALAANLS